jgi:hypothetical protein
LAAGQQVLDAPFPIQPGIDEGTINPGTPSQFVPEVVSRRETVLSGTARHEIVTAGTHQDVIAVVAATRVVSCIALQRVVPEAAAQRIDSNCTAKTVPPASSMEDVIAVAAY